MTSDQTWPQRIAVVDLSNDVVWSVGELKPAVRFISAVEWYQVVSAVLPYRRRRAYFLLAADTASQAWLIERNRAEQRRLPRLNRWSPQWTVTRSLAVSRAVAGDPGPLRQFLDTGLVDDETLEANLRYYGYWAGECDQTFSSDEFMVQGFPNWRGDRLLVALVRSLTTQSPYLELSVRTVWTLVARWPHLLDDPALAGPVGERVGALLDGTVLPVGTRRELDQINYAARWRGH